MIVSISWKNVWRNKLRSMVVIVSVAVGVMCGTFMIALMQGWIEQRSRVAIYVESSHIQIHAQGYRLNEDPKYQVANAEAIRTFILSQHETRSVASRTQVLAMATAGYRPSGFIVRGIVPEQERLVSELFRYVKDSAGSYFEEKTRQPIFLSEKSAKELRLQNYRIDSATLVLLHAKKALSIVIDSLETIKGKTYRNKIRFYRALQLKLGPYYEEWKEFLEKECAYFRLNKKVQLTVRSANGDEVSSVFRLVGVFRTNNSAFDAKYAYVLDKDLRSLTGWDLGQVHEIAVLAKNQEDVDMLVSKIKEEYPALDVQGWRELLPDIAMYADMMSFYAAVFMAIILFALGFGIVNTMLMVVLERTKELGMLMAIGMSTGRVFSMVIVETVLLSLVGGAIGMLAGMGLVGLFAHVGIDLSAFAEGMEAMGFASIIYPQMDLFYYGEIALLVVCIGIFSAVYPARKAVKLVPAEAIRTE